MPRKPNPAEAQVDVDTVTAEELQQLKESAVGIETTPPAEVTGEPGTTVTVAPEAAPPAVDDEGQPISESVPHGRYEHERQRRKDAEKRATEANERRIRLEERTNALLSVFQEAQRQQQQPASRPPVNRQENPLEYLDTVDNDLTELKQWRADRIRADREAAAWGQAMASYNADLARFAKAQPDLKDAMSYLADNRRDELAVFGVTDPVAQTNDINELERRLIVHALQTRRSPAELLYGLAVKRGWKAPAPNSSPGNGAMPSRPQSPAQVVEQVQRREATRQQATSLSGSGAPVASGEIGPQELIDMSDEEFAAYKKKFGERALSKTFGLN